MGTIK